MQIKLSFLGAAQNVTGSRFLVEVDGSKVLVDCGLYQERQFRDRNWDKFPVPPESIDAVCLTHAHLDHCGLLPKMVKEGFRGKIFCTGATAEIAQIIMLDSGHIQEEDAAYKRKRHAREGRKSPRTIVPLYTKEDAAKVEKHFSPTEYNSPVQVADGIIAVFREAGHVFGSSTITLTVSSNGETRKILFSGDLGRHDKPILADPDAPDAADYILVESTYGDRVHKPTAEVAGSLRDIVNVAVKAGGNIIIPSFALERSQELLYHLNELFLADEIPELKVFLDSPMAIRITEVFRNHPELFDAEMTKRLDQDSSPFEFANLKMTSSAQESKAINKMHESVIVIAGSGMCTGGRIKHHLINNISNPANTILFVGYQANGTLGRILAQGAEEVRIFGRTVRVEARIAHINGFSAHADRDEICNWLGGLVKAPRGVFVVHGEQSSATHFRDYLAEKKGWNVSAPEYKDEVILD